MQEMQALSLGCKDPLQKRMATPSIILAWEIPWTEESGGLQFMESQRVRYDLATKQQQHRLLGDTEDLSHELNRDGRVERQEIRSLKAE